MSTVTIYHNPRCSKSRETLALLQDRGLDITIVEYLKAPLSPAQIRELLEQLALPASALVRKKEAAAAGVTVATASEEELVQALGAHPGIMERPVVVCNGKARLGRPPEQVLEIL